MLNVYSGGYEMETLDPSLLSKNFGLTHTESLVFFELLRSGESPIGLIIKKTGLHRGTVYNTIQRLIEKGLVAQQKGDETTFYEASHFGLLYTIDEEEHLLKQKKKSIKQILHWMKINKQVNESESSDVRILYGNKALKGFYPALYETCRANEYTHYAIGSLFYERKKLTVMDFKKRQKFKIQMGLKSKSISDPSELSTKGNEFFRGHAKYLPNFSIPIAVYIYGDTSVYIDWLKDKTELICINNKNVADYNKKFFNYLWKQKAMKVSEVYTPIN